MQLNGAAFDQNRLERLNADLRAAVLEGIDSGPAIAAADLFAELNDRYAEPKPSTPKQSAKARGKRAVNIRNQSA